MKVLGMLLHTVYGIDTMVPMQVPVKGLEWLHHYCVCCIMVVEWVVQLAEFYSSYGRGH